MGIVERKKKIITDKTRYFFVYINAFFKQWVYGYMLKRNQLYLYVKPKDLIQVCTGLKYNTIVNMVSLLDIAVVDVPSRVLKRFEINYIFINYKYEYRLGLKIFTDGSYPIQSLNKLYKSSNWLEREAFDMFGIRFVFNYNLRRILTDYGFKGHPLRKDFPLIGYVDIYYDDSKHRVDVSFVETAQKLRFYNFENPWR